MTHVLYDLVARRPDLIEDIDPAEGLPELISKGRRCLCFVDTGVERGDTGTTASWTPRRSHPSRARAAQVGVSKAHQPRPAEVGAVLRRKVPPLNTREARFIAIEDVDEFLAFEALRRSALARVVPPEIAAAFDIEAAPGSDAHDCAWLRCPSFVVRHCRPEPRDAGRV